MKRLWFACVAFLLLLFPASAQEAPQNPFGIVEGFWFPEITCELGVGWERIIFDWSQHQPEKPSDWNTLNVDDRWLKSASQCQREVVGLLKNTPAWATDAEGGAGVPKNLDLPIDDLDNYWAGFVRKTVDYYGSRGVTHFIIWNEPDIDKDTYGHEFSGELDDYFQLLKVAYLAAKSVNPAAQIHLAGTTYWHDVNEGREPYFERLLDRILEDPDAATNGYYFDVMSLHIYFRTETVLQIVREMQSNLLRHGMDKAIWINEMNAAPTDDPDWQVVRPQYPLDLDQQASFLVQGAVMALYAGVERIAVYKLYDQQVPAGAESFGILNPASGAARPAYYAWQFVTRQFTHVTKATFAETDTVQSVKLSHTNGQATYVFWARTEQPTQVNVPATSDKAYLIDQTGGIRLLTPVEGVYTLALPGARCNEADGCFIGGHVWTVVQPDGDGEVREVWGSEVITLVYND